MASDAGLLERERELSAIDALVAEARGGTARFAVVEARAGIGKSRLLAAARERAAAHGFLTCAARGTELEGEFAYGVVRQLFEPLRTDPEAWEAALAGAAEPARAVFEAPAAVSDGDEAVRDASF